MMTLSIPLQALALPLLPLRHAMQVQARRVGRLLVTSRLPLPFEEALQVLLEVLLVRRTLDNTWLLVVATR